MALCSTTSHQRSLGSKWQEIRGTCRQSQGAGRALRAVLAARARRQPV